MKSSRLRNFEPRHEEKIKQTKIHVCGAIRKSCRVYGWDNRQTAFFIGTSASNISRALRFEVEDLTLSQLFRYLVVLEPNFEILISNN